MTKAKASAGEAEGDQAMLEVPGYAAAERIGENTDTCFYRLADARDGSTVIAMTTRDEYPGEDTAAAYRREFDMLRMLDGRGAVRPVSLLFVQQRPILLAEDFGGWPLSTLLRSGPANKPTIGRDAGTLLTLAFQAAMALSLVHSGKVIHQAVQPFNIFVNPETLEARFCGFQWATFAGEQRPLSEGNAGRPQDMLPYISPEQTGRLNRRADKRTDIYSIGVVMYESFAGRLPFGSTDELELIYSHIAGQALPLTGLASALPEIVSDIVLKCLNKAPEDRYNTAYGLQYDLKLCLDEFARTGAIAAFSLGGQDFSSQWQYPNKLYGRTAEREWLLRIRERVAKGHSELVLISGATGIGKTAFVHDTLREIVSSGGGLFIGGKFDPYRSDIPYAAWIQAIEDLVRQLLASSPDVLAGWKERIARQIGEYGQLLIELVPQLERLIGKQPQVQQLSPHEAEGSFQRLFELFLLVFASADQPLTVFLDDLQWGDEASLQLITHLFGAGRARQLLLIGTYRGGELQPHYPLRKWKEAMDAAAAPIRHIRMEPLRKDDVRLLLADAMPSTAHDVNELAEVLMQKTGGTPFSLKPLLQNAYDRALIAFNEQTRQWEWGLSGIAAIEGAKRAGGFWSGKLDSLPAETIGLLSWAAFLGRRSEFASLVEVSGLSRSEALKALQPALEEFVLESSGAAQPDEPIYTFLHDRIQQDFYMRVPADEQAVYHERIGRMLRARLNADPDKESLLFEAVSHLNYAIRFIGDETGKRELARLNYRAGVKAKMSTAYDAALRYFLQSTSLLAEFGWERCFDFTFKVYKARMECEYLCNRRVVAIELFEILLPRCTTVMEQVGLYNTMIELEVKNQIYDDAAKMSVKALQLLDIKVHDESTNLRTIFRLLKMRIKMGNLRIKDLRKLPPMTDERYLAAMSLFTWIGNMNYMRDNRKWLGAILSMLNLTLDHGIAPESSVAFIGMAFFYNYAPNDYVKAYEWAELARELPGVSPTLRLYNMNTYFGCYDTWRKYEPELFDLFISNVKRTRLESGNLWNANQSAIVASGMILMLGKPLGEAYVLLMENAGEIARSHNDLQWKITAILSSLIVRLTGERHRDDPFADIDVNGAAFALNANGELNKGLEEIACMHGYLLGYLFGQYEKAYEFAARADQLFLEQRKKGVFEYTSHGFHYVLIIAQLYPTASRERQKKFMGIIRHHHRMLKKYASGSPVNYLHKYLLIKAELYRLGGRAEHAARCYEEAYADAKSNGHIHNAAIAAENAAKLYLGSGKHHLATAYLNMALRAYMDWGAKAKAADMTARYRYLLHADHADKNAGIDYIAVMKSAQAISEEMVMERLLDRLIRILMQNSGAEKVALIFEEDGRMYVEAYATHDEIRLGREPLEQAGYVSAAVIGRVRSTLEEIVLHNAHRDGPFAQSAYMQDQHKRSVLCLPIVKNHRLICILYLENNMAAGVFTQDRLDVIKLLCAQCAISLDNAKLYSNIERLKESLEDQVTERTLHLERSMRETAAALAEASIQTDRNRIAADVHDIVGHTLTSTILQIEAGKRQLRNDSEGAYRRFHGAQELLRQGLEQIRQSLHMVKEGPSYDYIGSLHKLILDTKQNADVTIDTDIGPLPELNGAYHHVIYRSLQEGLTNGIRHGCATAFRFSLGYDGQHLTFSLRDNGKGTNCLEPGFGLRSMKERVEEMGGRLSVHTLAGKGCTLQIEIPYASGKEDRIYEQRAD